MTDADAWAGLVDLDRLAAWLSDEGLGSGAITEPVALTGGSQNLLLRFSFGGSSYVLRRPPAHPHTDGNKTNRREATILAALRGSDVPHPGLIAACGDPAVLGAAFYVMQPIDGFAPSVGLPSVYTENASWRARMGLALVETLQRLGDIDYVAAGLGDFGKVDGFLERQVGRWISQLEGYARYEGWGGPGALPDISRVVKWLDNNRPSHFKPGILHGDYHLANVMFRHDAPEIAAVIDWELSTIGDPLVDLGWLLATWPGDDGPGPGAVGCTPWSAFASEAELVRAYSEGSARDLSALDWYVVLACFKLGTILEGTHARACAGKASREMGDYLHEATIRLFNRAQARAGI